jgi:hypothetical protein
MSAESKKSLLDSLEICGPQFYSADRDGLVTHSDQFQSGRTERKAMKTMATPQIEAMRRIDEGVRVNDTAADRRL